MITGDTVRFSAYTLAPATAEAIHDALRGRRVAVITGEKSWQAAESRLPRLDICCHMKYGGECTMDIIGACAEAGADAILGIGGGKALDVAKAAAQMIGLPVYTLPTIAATCAAVTALSIVYHADGKLDRFLFLDAPPAQAFLDTELLATAPSRYFRAGLADAMAKHLECVFSMRNDTPTFVNGLGAAISASIFEPLLSSGAQAYADCEAGMATEAFADALQRVIVSVGMTSLLIGQEYNGAIAHSICYGLGALPGVEHRILHGEMVGYGCLVQLAVDDNTSRLAALRVFLSAIGSPITLREMDLPLDAQVLDPALEETLKSPDMAHLPYPVDKAMLWRAIQTVEALES